MTNLLLRLFVPNASADDLSAHAAIGKLAGITGILCNILLAAIKLTAALLTGSVAIAGDGINNLTDSASSLVTLLGFRMAQRPADKEHPFGHGRYEYVSGLAVAAMVLLAGVELVKSSFKKILQPESVSLTALTLAILLVSIGLKLWMAVFNRRLAKMIRSKTLDATSQDSRNDVIATGAVLLCLLADNLFHVRLDGYAGMGVAAFIIWSGIRLAKETVSPLLGMQADEALVKELTDLILSHQRVLGIHDLMIHDYGPGRCFATVHAEMDAAESPLDAHDQLDHIEQQALCRLGVHLVIHYDPISTDTDLTAYRSAAEECLCQAAPGASIHDLRITNYHCSPKLTFDLAVPYDLNIPDEVLMEHLQESILRAGCTIPIEIRIDRQE